MSQAWKLAERRSMQFDESAIAYDRYRPRYPAQLVDDIVELGALRAGARVLEIGAGTGIGTAALLEHGLCVVAIEPSAGMRRLAQEKLGDTAQFVDGRFEDWRRDDPVDGVVAFSAWHWVEPDRGLDLLAAVLPRGGALCVAWTEIVSWGQGDFEERLAEVTGSPWPKTVWQMLDSLGPVADDDRFGDFSVRRHLFERNLDAEEFVGLTRTYTGFHTPERDARFKEIIDQDFAGSVKRVEEAVLYVSRRN